MRPRIFEVQASICQFCNFIALRRPLRPKTVCRPSTYVYRSRCFATERIRTPKTRPSTKLVHTPPKEPQPQLIHRKPTNIQTRAESQIGGDEDSNLEKVTDLQYRVLSSSSIPPENLIREVFEYCEAIADSLVGPYDQSLGNKDGSAASALLSVDQASTQSSAKLQKFSPTAQKKVDQLSNIAYSLLAHPPVLITPDVLGKYIKLQSRLRKPDTFPEIFHLYASKPLPQEGSIPVEYKNQNPNRIANAIKITVADRALQTAIDSKKLVLAMDIVESAYATKAFRRNKFVRQCSIPLAALSVTPIAAYEIASEVTKYQTTTDPAVATNITFAGILAYVGFTSMLGIVAITTANDQMDRVTWAPGMPLRERWIREEERAAIDRIAGSWGFRETWRRGEEEGEEWDALREWIGHKGMILDRVELMDGME